MNLEPKVRTDADLADAIAMGRVLAQRAVALVKRTVEPGPLSDILPTDCPTRWEVVAILDAGKTRADAVEDWIVRDPSAEATALSDADWRGGSPALVEFASGRVEEFAVAYLSLEFI